MPKFDYDKSFALASKLLTKFGGSGTLRKKDFTTPDQTTPWDRTNVPVDTEATMVIVPLGRVRFAGMNFGISAPAAETHATHEALVLWDDAAEIIPDDELIYQGKTWKIGSATPVKPYTTGVIWLCEIWGDA